MPSDRTAGVGDAPTSREPKKWQDDRACRDIPVRVFHDLAWYGSSRTRAKGFDDAVEICEVCPVRARCLEYAIDLPDVDGVFGGYDPEQIRKMKKNRNQG